MSFPLVYLLLVFLYWHRRVATEFWLKTESISSLKPSVYSSFLGDTADYCVDRQSV